MIFVFIVIVIGLLSATISYYKGFKVNSRILLSIDKYAGYNKLSKDEIESYLSSIGYTNSNDQSIQEKSCPFEKNRGTLITAQNVASSTSYLYCVYYHKDDRSKADKTNKIVNNDNQPIYYNYSVTSYIYVNLPIVGSFKIPVYTKGERIYNFSDGQPKGA